MNKYEREVQGIGALFCKLMVIMLASMLAGFGVGMIIGVIFVHKILGVL